MSRPNRQDSAAERRRRRQEPLERWFHVVERVEVEVRSKLGLGDDAVVPSGVVAMEVLRLADPYAVPGLDVVIPGTRADLAQRWIEARLSGRGNTPEDRWVLAREIAPLPDEHLLPYFDRSRKRTRWRSANQEQDAITAAAEERFRADREAE